MDCSRRGVAAVPEKGKANAALIKLITNSLGPPKPAFLIVSGERGKNKQIFIKAVLGEVVAWHARFL